MPDLTRAHYEVTFQKRYIRSTGESFQDLFSSIMAMRYPGDFARVRPWGKIGDRKNDGYLRSRRQLFQCYAPRELNIAVCITKVKEDFTGALPYWREHFDQWLFTHNDIDGLPADVLRLLLDLSERNQPLVLAHFGYAELLAEFKELTLPNLANLLGPALTLNDVMAVRVDGIDNLLTHIALQPESLTADVRPVPAEKLEYNQLSPAVKTLLKAGMTRAELVRTYLRGRADQTRADRTAAAFRTEYETLKAQGLPPDGIFTGLQRFISGDSVTSPSHQAATLAILAHLFEACDIFERPDDLPVS